MRERCGKDAVAAAAAASPQLRNLKEQRGRRGADRGSVTTVYLRGLRQAEGRQKRSQMRTHAARPPEESSHLTARCRASA